MVEVKIYTKDNCPSCDLAKKWLNENDFSFTTITMNDYAERVKFYDEINKNIPQVENHIKTVPQIFIGDDRIGGYDDLMAKTNEVIAKIKGA